MQKVKLNIVPKGVKKTAYLSQNDNGRVVRYELFNELIPYTLDGSETITVTVVRPDGEEIVSSVPNTEEAYIDVTFNDDMSAIAGVGAGEIKITDGETVLGSHNFDINVELDAYNGKDVVIETETGTLLSFNTEVEDNALEYESEIPYNAEGYTGLRVINSRTAPVYNKTPYLFRKTPDGSGNSCIEKLNGFTVAFNQLVETYRSNASYAGVTLTNNTDYVHLQGLTTAEDNMTVATLLNGTIPQGHKFLAWLHGVTSSDFKIVIGSPALSSSYGSFAVIGQSTGATMSIALGFKSSVSIDNDVRVNCVDLTQMFGSTIADYIYSLETQTAGAGVALFKSLGFDKPYYPYNAGELMSSKPTSKKVVGFNQWDEEWEQGYYDATGSKVSNSNAIRSKNYIPCFPNTVYYYYNGSVTGGRICYFNADKDFISTETGSNKTFIPPANCCFITISTPTQYGGTYLNDICINISDADKNGTYEPYSEETYNLGGDELRGLLKLDANNNIFAYGDTKTSDGNIKRKFVIVDLGSLNWTLRSTGTNNKGWSSYLPSSYKVKEHDPMYWIAAPYSYIGLTAGQVIETNGADSFERGVYGYKTADGTITQVVYFIGSVNESPSGYLVYELATPTTESADPFDNPQEVKITEEFIDERPIPIPVGHDTIYGTDIEYQDIDFDTTIFGGDINAIDGVLTSRYNSDGSVKTTPDVIELDPALIPVKAGDNNIFNSASGAQTIRYYNQED